MRLCLQLQLCQQGPINTANTVQEGYSHTLQRGCNRPVEAEHNGSYFVHLDSEDQESSCPEFVNGEHLKLHLMCGLNRAPADRLYKTWSQAAIYKRPKGALGFPTAWYCCAETMTGTRLNMRSCSGSVTGCRLLSFLRQSRLLMPLTTSMFGRDGSKEAGAAFLGRLMSRVLQAACQHSCPSQSVQGVPACPSTSTCSSKLVWDA